MSELKTKPTTSIERCPVCKKNLNVIKQKYIVEYEGQRFCSEACAELWEQNN